MYANALKICVLVEFRAVVMLHLTHVRVQSMQHVAISSDHRSKRKSNDNGLLSDPLRRPDV